MEEKIQTDEKAEIAEGIASDCKEKLSEAEPALLEALDALKTLKESDFTEMKSFLKPPAGIRLIMEGVCIFMGMKGKKGEKGAIDYWDDSRKLLEVPSKFITKLEKYDRENISD